MIRVLHYMMPELVLNLLQKGEAFLRHSLPILVFFLFCFFFFCGFFFVFFFFPTLVLCVALVTNIIPLSGSSRSFCNNEHDEHNFIFYDIN